MASGLFGFGWYSWGVLLLVGAVWFGWWVLYVRPKFFSSPEENPNARLRGNSMLILETGDFKFIQSRKNHIDNTVTLIFEDGSRKIYHLDDMMPINKAQIISGRSFPVWIEAKAIQNLARELLKDYNDIKTQLEMSKDIAEQYRRQFVLLQRRIKSEERERIEQYATLINPNVLRQQQPYDRPIRT